MDRVQLKLAGKRNFKKNYGRSVGVCLLPFVPVLTVSIVFGIWLWDIIKPIIEELFKYSNYNSYYGYKYSYSYRYRFDSFSDLSIDKATLLNFLVVFGIVVLVLILLMCVLNVMICRFFLMNRRQPSKVFATIFSFKGSEYFKVFCGMFLKNLYEFLWSLLLIVPGIVKSFSYFMVPYILAENPNIGANRAITISKQTMKGAKGELFVFYLSFIGWFLLCNLPSCLQVLSLPLDVFYVRPYFVAAKAEFYCSMKRKAKKLKICNAKELA